MFRFDKFPGYFNQDVVKSPDFCHRFRVGADGLLETNDVPELQSDHKEADTRMLLHAKHASHDHANVVIRSPDMDIFVLAGCHKSSFDASLYFVTGTGDNCRIIDINKIQEELGSDFSLALIGFHAFTGTILSHCVYELYVHVNQIYSYWTHQ